MLYIYIYTYTYYIHIYIFLFIYPFRVYIRQESGSKGARGLWYARALLLLLCAVFSNRSSDMYYNMRRRGYVTD